MNTLLRSSVGRWRRLIAAGAFLTAAWTPAVYVACAAVVRSEGLFTTMVANKPYRDGYRTFFVPWGVGDDYSEQLISDISKQIDNAGIVLVADPIILPGVQYARETGRLPQAVQIVWIQRASDHPQAAECGKLLADALVDGLPVVLVPHERDCPQTCVQDARWERHGDIYRLTGLTPTERE